MKISKDSKKRFINTILVIVISVFLITYLKEAFILTAVSDSDYELINKNFINPSYSKLYSFTTESTCLYLEFNKEGDLENAKTYFYSFNEDKNLIIDEIEFRILNNSFMNIKNKELYYSFEGNFYE